MEGSRGWGIWEEEGDEQGGGAGFPSQVSPGWKRCLAGGMGVEEGSPHPLSHPQKLIV